MRATRRTRRRRRRHKWLGMTLLEVLVTLVVLALLTSVATLAPRQTPSEHGLRAMLRDSLMVAIAEGRAITIIVRVDDREESATVLPDGRIVADSAFFAEATERPAR